MKTARAPLGCEEFCAIHPLRDFTSPRTGEALEHSFEAQFFWGHIFDNPFEAHFFWGHIFDNPFFRAEVKPKHELGGDGLSP